MRYVKSIFFPSLIFLSIIFFPSYIFPVFSGAEIDQSYSDTTKWIAPESADELANPIEVTEKNLKEGQKLYRKHCRSCHGRLGDGKGSGIANLKTVVTDFTNPEFLNQTDGSMYWKIAEGRDEMESYKKKMYEEDIWLTVIYIKTFAAKE